MSDLGGQDEPTRAVPHAQDDGWYDGAHASGEPMRPAPAPSAGSSATGSSRNRWLVPLLLVACGIAAFAVVTLLMKGGGDGSKTAATSPSANTSGSPTVVTTSVSGSASASGSVGASATSPGSSGITAAFPAGVHTVCGGGDEHEEETQEPLPAEVRVSAADGHIPGCLFAKRVHAFVDGKVAADPAASHFEGTEHSDRNTSLTYQETCERSDHLTTCTFGPTDSHHFVVYVRDRTN